MKKIINALLAVKFPDVDIASLLEVVEATPNPTVATEILCGLYEKPEVPEYSVPRYNNGVVCKFKSFDKWKTKVNYTYVHALTEGGYFLKSTPRESITMDNFHELLAGSSVPSEDKIHYQIPTGKTKLAKSYCSLSDWEYGVDKVDQITGDKL